MRRKAEAPATGAQMATATLERPSRTPVRRPLGEILVLQEAATSDAVDAALRHQEDTERRIGELLVQLGVVSERDVAAAVAAQRGLRMADLRSQSPDPEALAALPERVARAVLAFPLHKGDDGILVVAVADPTPEAERALREGANGARIQMLAAAPSDVQLAIDSRYRVLTDVDQYVEAFRASDGRKKADAVARDDTSEDAPIVQVVSKILAQAARDRASDVHIEPQGDILKVRFRTDGTLRHAIELPGDLSAAVVSRLKVMAGMNIVERRRSQDGQLTTEIDGRTLDVRVATTATIWGERCVLRLLDKSRPLYKLADLGMPPDTGERYSKLVRSPFGMVIVAGPTGSGKTTTLYASLNEISGDHRNLMTVEDPVEYVFPSINQIQINEQAGLTFAGGLKAILRQDPDVILVGEIRDVETARIAVQSALTGHFVLSSLHATDSAAALHRFLDMGIESFLISSSILAVVAQRLVRRICTACAAPYVPSDEEMSFYETVGSKKKTTFMIGSGCNLCNDTGYLDRIGVYEVLKISPEIRRLIVGWATQEELRKMAVSQGMRTLLDEALSLVEQDVTTIAEVIRSIYVV